jgi:hypothetical protein
MKMTQDVDDGSSNGNVNLTRTGSIVETVTGLGEKQSEIKYLSMDSVADNLNSLLPHITDKYTSTH